MTWLREPSWGHSPTGGRRWWTEERVLETLRRYIAESTGMLPVSQGWSALKKGRPDLPPHRRILEYHGEFPRAWLAAGARRERVPLLMRRWSEEETELLREWAGSVSCRIIGRRLHRSPDAVKRHVYALGFRIRENTGHLSVSQVAAEYGVSIHRVYTFVRDGRLPARRPKGVKNRWLVDPADVERCVALHLPKQTWRGTPPAQQVRRRTHQFSDGSKARIAVLERG